MPRPPDFGVKLFLDVDGVIAPYANRDAEHRESLFVSVPSRFDGRPPRTYTLTYSPSVIAELELLIVDFRLDLVFLSTWNANHAIQLLVEKLGAFQHFRALPIPLPRMSGYPKRWKVEALVRDLRKSPSPFIWIDDEIGTQRKEARNAFPVPSLIIQPESVDGLTNEHLSSMRQFLTR